MDSPILSATRPEPEVSTWRNRLLLWLPVGAALVYPCVLTAFHLAVSGHGSGPLFIFLAGFWLILAFALPLSCLALAMSERAIPLLGRMTPAARRTAFLGLAAPPLFVLVGVAPGLLHSPLGEGVIWPVAWVTLGLAATLAPAGESLAMSRPSGWLRVCHGVAGALILVFVGFHLLNHLSGLLGPDLHTRVMKAGRQVYRSPFVEPLLVGLLLFQVGAGLRLAWRWTGRPLDVSRGVQVGSGVYLAAFIVTHMNSALVSARTVHHTDTNWAWAAGLPQGLLMDDWNIRLLPHYALGVFFIVSHLFCGLRDVLLAHRVSTAVAERVWRAGVVGAAALAIAIVSGLCGVRV